MVRRVADGGARSSVCAVVRLRMGVVEGGLRVCDDQHCVVAAEDSMAERWNQDCPAISGRSCRRGGTLPTMRVNLELNDERGKEV